MTRRLGRWSSVLLALSVLAPASGEPGTGTKVAARPLVRLAHGSLAAFGMELRRIREEIAKTEGSMPEPTPMATALKQAARSMQLLEEGLAAKDARWFRGLVEGDVALAMMRVVWARADVRTDVGTQALDDLLAMWDVLGDHFGPAPLRARAGDALTETEAKRFESIRQTMKGLQTRVTVLKSEAGSKIATRQLDDLLATAHLVAAAPATSAAYVASLTQLHKLEGEWTATGYYVSPARRAAWGEASAWARDAFALWRVWSLEGAECLPVSDWAWAAEPVELTRVPTATVTDEVVGGFDAIVAKLPEVGPREHGEAWALAHPEEAGGPPGARDPDAEGAEKDGDPKDGGAGEGSDEGDGEKRKP